MIVQEINLYQDRFKEKKIWLSSMHILLLVGLSILFLVFSSYWYKQQLATVESQNKFLQSSKEAATVKLESLRKEMENLLANHQLDDEIIEMNNKISSLKRVIKFVSTNQFGSGKGFSSELEGLSEIKVNNVWLNEISLAEDYVKLTGSSLKAEKIPEYFNLFRARDLFEGLVFEDFELKRNSQQDWKVDFLIASQADTDE